MELLLAQWRSRGLLAQLSRHKDVFMEPRGVTEAEAVWSAYSKSALRTGVGAVLFCVMGGKLSEGINFSNELARSVVVIGMPFPDGRDPVLQEKMKQADRMEHADINSSASSTGTTTTTTAVAGAGVAGRKLYEAICMNSVNQSIGRSIRHAGDYAAILLIDQRYKQSRIVAQLPLWIRRSVVDAGSLREATDALSAFYQRKAQTRA
jgi:chromosome transmission fidelity protein 1